jgi:hypothetical protein
MMKHLLLAIAFSAAGFGQVMHVTLPERTAVPGATLEPGAYVLSVADSLPDRKIVQVVPKSGGQPVYFAVAPNPRLPNAGKSPLLYWSRSGSARALRAWFIPGESIAAEAIYPKDEALELARRNGEPVPAVDPETDRKVPADARLSREDLAILELWSLDYGPVDSPNRELAATKLERVAWRPAAASLPRTASPYGAAAALGLALALMGAFAWRRA